MCILRELFELYDRTNPNMNESLAKEKLDVILKLFSFSTYRYIVLDNYTETESLSYISAHT